ncbi:hypothetical protein [Staphylococcus pseudintermedius]|uniref:hypothetical protein n=1 Tax=Staphylococcus pseudintermedius TaxID=283734 RepID=UPI0015E865AB|nr:hypothetical protein [Staphylococcus pseudintermedius]
MMRGASNEKEGHANDITEVKSKMEGFKRKIAIAIEYARSLQGTLVIAIADHSTGGLSMLQGSVCLLYTSVAADYS